MKPTVIVTTPLIYALKIDIRSYLFPIFPQNILHCNFSRKIHNCAEDPFHQLPALYKNPVCFLISPTGSQWLGYINQSFLLDLTPSTTPSTPGNEFTKQENNETRISPRIFLFFCWNILFGPIGREKQNFTSFLLVEIKLLMFRCLMFLKSVLRCQKWNHQQLNESRREVLWFLQQIGFYLYKQTADFWQYKKHRNKNFPKDI